eukprot:5306960-Pyramimonas_sp.AAC.1
MESADIPEDLVSVTQASGGQPVLDQAVDAKHLLELARDCQAGGWWKVRSAPLRARPVLGR